MTFAYRTAVRTFLCTGLLLGSGALALAQEPAGQQTAPDNTKVNERDRSKDEPTADQQKDNRSDQDITQQIRQSIMNDKSLSTYAHNVKVITQNGQVTLKFAKLPRHMGTKHGPIMGRRRQLRPAAFVSTVFFSSSDRTGPFSVT